jgi:hypothetical protein
MQSFTISDSQDRRYPFSRAVFEDRFVLYHGSWSRWSPTMERDGFIHNHLPFDWRNVATVFKRTKLSEEAHSFYVPW